MKNVTLISEVGEGIDKTFTKKNTHHHDMHF